MPSASIRQEKQGLATYIQFPEEIENANGFRKSFGKWGNFIANYFGGKCATFDKSVLFWAQKNFEYKYGTGFRDKSLANSDRNIFKADEDSETKEEREKSWGS